MNEKMVKIYYEYEKIERLQGETLITQKEFDRLCEEELNEKKYAMRNKIHSRCTAEAYKKHGDDCEINDLVVHSFDDSFSIY